MLIATVGGKSGWLAFGMAFTFAAWGGLLLAVVHVKPRPEATRSGGDLIVRPPALTRYGVPVVLCGPWFVVMPLASAKHPWFWVAFVFSAGVAGLVVAAFQRRIRVVDGGFEEVGLNGRAMRVPWTSVKSVRYDGKHRCLLLVVRCLGQRDRNILFPSGWDGVATLAAAALTAIPEEALRPATQERLALEQLAALPSAPPT